MSLDFPVLHEKYKHSICYIDTLIKQNFCRKHVFYPHGCADNLFCNKTIKVLLSLVEHSFLQHIKSLNYLYNLLYLN